ncbi:glycoside hydrolase family 25 protein [Bacteroides sp. 519]|uniref:glycoside hydrolase family 25 protein n=1 Tax=Bacteroides sp. 519 TaxID=2302937 RepID=UPI0013D6B867|nr:glycoside hydrolase family 25 protein [Bacteroides sp. 519]NDV59393.1 glycoside hydrolase family 25 protein [Bacteroides sp. 519]
MPIQNSKQKTKYRKKPKARRKTKPKTRKNFFGSIPAWVKHLFSLGIIFLFSVSFYYHFIRPYPYFWKPCRGVRGYGVCLPDGYPVHGIDISHHQGNIDWYELAKNKEIPNPIRFIFMKATEGGDLGDNTFARNFYQARQHGFIRGAYHFFSPKTDIKKQADFFIKNVKLQSGDFPPVLDVEVLGNNTKTELQRKVIYWLTRMESHYGVKPIIYASYKFKTDYLDSPLFDDFPYWIAHYYVDSVYYTGKWTFWQHSDKGHVAGIKERVDLNVFNGELEELEEILIN